MNEICTTQLGDSLTEVNYTFLGAGVPSPSFLFFALYVCACTLIKRQVICLCLYPCLARDNIGIDGSVLQEDACNHRLGRGVIMETNEGSFTCIAEEMCTISSQYPVLGSSLI